MKRQNLSFVTQVNSCHVTDNGDTITIRSTTPVVDDIVMNGGLYPADEIANSYASLEGTPAPLDHPIDKDGQFISASNGDGLQKFYVGAVNKNVSYKDGVVESDVVINKAQALAHPRGQELIDRLANKEPIHISTGLMLQREQATGNSKGKDYTWIARNMKYDHVAILLNSEGAGTPSDGVGMWTNAEKTEFVVNHQEVNEDKSNQQIDEMIYQALSLYLGSDAYAYPEQTFDDYFIYSYKDETCKQSYEIVDDKVVFVGEKQKVKRSVTYTAANIFKKVIDMLANGAPKGYNNPQAHIVPNNDSPENLQMNEEEVKALIAANASDAETKLQKKLDAVDAEHMKLKEEMKALKGGMKANEDAKKADLVAKVAKTLGLEANTIEGTSIEGLEALLGKSKSIAQVNSGGDDSANPYYSSADLEGDK
jgi:hypothetical protein